MTATKEDWLHFYADEVRLTANVKSSGLVEAFARVLREKFMGAPPWQIPIFDPRSMTDDKNFKPMYFPTNDPRDLYHNILIGLDPPKGLNNGHPSSLAYWIDALELKPGDRVYHLGCGVGYYTAIMAEVVGTSGSVIGSEVHAELGARAKDNLAGYRNVTVEVGEDNAAPFDPGDCDAIFVNAGMTHILPMWLDRLREDGRMLVPLTASTNPGIGHGLMAKIVRSGGLFAAETTGTVGIFSAVGLRDASFEESIQAAIESQKLSGMKSVRRDDHEPTDTCILHLRGACLSGAEMVGVEQLP